MNDGAIEFRGIGRNFGAAVAVRDFSHRFEPGQVHALMGKNGSGKSTIVNMLSGALPPSRGELFVNGRQTRFEKPSDAMDAGIATVHQELSLVRSLSIGENIYLGRLPRRILFGVSIIDWTRLYEDASGLLADMGLTLDPHVPVSTLSVGQQQAVEIVKAMSTSPSILLLDEPTSALAAPEVEQLFGLIRRLRERGVTMIYITHRMNELFKIADTCSVLRDGNHIASFPMADANPSLILEMMFGAVAKARRPARRSIDRTDAILSVKSLSCANLVKDLSFTLYKGEVLGLAGLLGSGRTETLRAIFGADPFESGEIVFNDTKIKAPSPRGMKRRGLGYTPENRKEVGLVQILSSHSNLCLASMTKIAPSGIVDRSMEQPYVERQIRDLHIAVSDPHLPVSSLSGGNQQKIVIGNWLNTEPKVMFFDEPSRGIDVQAKQQIFEIIWGKAALGVSAIFVSSELEEVLEVSDRILILYRGRLIRDVLPEDTTLTDLYRLCMEGA
jgi:ribose transport system ATP-binding protein